jgi:hypothetical protein
MSSLMKRALPHGVVVVVVIPSRCPVGQGGLKAVEAPNRFDQSGQPVVVEKVLPGVNKVGPKDRGPSPAKRRAL